MATIDPKLREWATERQRQIIDAVIEHGTHRKAAKALGVNHSTVDKRIAEVKRKAARAGYSPEHDLIRPAPSGVAFAGASTYYEATETTPAQWVKYKADKHADRYKDLHESFLAAIEDVEPKKKLVRPPKSPAKDLMCVIPIGDPHVGMYSWAAETGENYDLEIAESLLYGGVDYLVGSAPEADTCMVLNLGDFYHADNTENRTMRSGHALDVDSRWAKVLQVGHRIMIRCIDRALERFKTVIVRSEIGNHDDHSSVSLALHLSAYYRNEPRVVIDVDAVARKRYYFRFGRCLIGTSHGHECKPDKLAMAMPNEAADDWSASRYRKWYCGHFHSTRKLEVGGCVVEYYRTMASKDAWAFGAGYQSDRDMTIETWHSSGRIVGTNVVTAMQMGFTS